MNRSMILGAIFAAVFVAIIMWVRGRRSAPATSSSSPSPSPSGTDLHTRMQSIVPGMPRAEVERRLGPPPAKAGEEWVYYLDKHSGYRIAFDSVGAVTQVQAWVS